jgi:hypothetical protein
LQTAPVEKVFNHQAIRVLFLAPRLGEAAAVSLEVPAMLGRCWIAAAWSVRTFADYPGLALRSIMGLAAFAVLMATEFGAASFIFDQSAAHVVKSYGSLAGAIGLSAQIAFAFFPLLQARGARKPA